MKATPLSILLTKKVNTNLPARDPKLLTKVLGCNDREITRYWRRTIKPERY